MNIKENSYSYEQGIVKISIFFYGNNNSHSKLHDEFTLFFWTKERRLEVMIRSNPIKMNTVLHAE